MIENLLLWLGYGLCHQLPQRSFFGGAYQVPVCARDTGIYLGFVVSFLIVVAFARGGRPAMAPARWLIVVGVVLIAAMGVDGLTSYAGWRPTSNEIRLATGIGAGYAVALFMAPMLNSELWRFSGGRSRPLEGPWASAVWLVSMPVLYAVTLWLLPFLGLGYPLIVSLAILVTFTVVNLVLVALVWPQERRPEKASQTVPMVAAAFLLGAFEVAGAAALKAWMVSLASYAARRG